MPLTLAISDNADGTGGVATISGAAAETITVYSQTVNGQLGTATWTSRGSRSGDGTVNVSPGDGYYWWYASGATSGISNLVYQNLSSGTQAVLYRCLTGVQALVQSLALSGVANGSIVVRKLPIDRFSAAGEGLSLPAIVIAPWGTETMRAADGTNERDDVGYPVAVTIFAADQQHLTQDLDTYTKWREQIARTLRQNTLSGVSEIYTCQIEPGPIVDLAAWVQKTLFVSGLVARYTSREVRGFGA